MHQKTEDLMTKVFKITNGISPTIMDNVSHNIHNFQTKPNKNKKAVGYGQKTIKFRTPLLQANLHELYKHADSFNNLTEKLKTGSAKHALISYAKFFETI